MLDQFPDECWALVLSRLDSKADKDAAALTCRLWRALSSLERHSLRFFEGDNLRKDQAPDLQLFLLEALTCLPNVLSIIIKCHSPGNVYTSFPCVFQHKGFAKLTRLDLYVAKAHMTDYLLQCLATGCPLLTHLTLHDAGMITDAGMYSLAHGCPLLQILNMNQTCHRRERGVITDEGMDVLLNKCVGMRELSIEGWCAKGWGFRHGKRLEKVKAIYCSITDEGLAEGFRGNTSLRKLSLQDNFCHLSMSTIRDFGKGLEVLKLTEWYNPEGYGDIALRRIAEACPNLRVLNVDKWFSAAIDAGIWRAVGLLSNKLEKLNVCSWPDIRDAFNREWLLAIEEGFPNLRSLVLLHHLEDDPATAHFREYRPNVKVRFKRI